MNESFKDTGPGVEQLEFRQVDPGSVLRAADVSWTRRGPLPYITPVCHRLKVWPKSFKAFDEGLLKFDMRKDDRGFQIGDVVHYMEYKPVERTFTGKALVAIITYKVRAGEYPGLQPGFCLLGLDFPHRAMGCR